ncbi:MAG TPA: hypothetical protein VGQ71_07890 [Terriglobales bacterium]|nr:hypothetical protein [Terriglobales bacterium]
MESGEGCAATRRRRTSVLFKRAISMLILVLLTRLVFVPLLGQQVYVSSCATSAGTGSSSSPYNTLSRAVTAAPPGSTLVIAGGSYPDAITIQKNLALTASGGRVLVGGQFVGTQEICVPITDDSCAWSFPLDPSAVFCSENPLGARAKLYYPAAGPGNAPVACGGPFPLIVYAHGNRNYPSCDGSTSAPPQDDYRQADGILSPLAAAGFIVISVDVSWFRWGGAVEKATIILNALAFARDENARSGSRLKGAVDMGRVGLAGHSTGGTAAVGAANYLREQFCAASLDLGEVRAAALALLAPGFTGAMPFAPALVIHGTTDTGQVGDGPLKTYEGATGPKHLVVVTGANHYGYTDALCVAPPDDGLCEVGGVAGQDARRRQQRTAGNYVEAFFSYYLRGATTKRDYLLQQSGEQCGHPGDPPTCGSPRRRFEDLNSLNVEVNICSCPP